MIESHDGQRPSATRLFAYHFFAEKDRIALAYVKADLSLLSGIFSVKNSFSNEKLLCLEISL